MELAIRVRIRRTYLKRRDLAARPPEVVFDSIVDPVHDDESELAGQRLDLLIETAPGARVDDRDSSLLAERRETPEGSPHRLDTDHVTVRARNEQGIVGAPKSCALGGPHRARQGRHRHGSG